MLHKRTNAAGIKEGNLCLRGKYITAVPGEDTKVDILSLNPPVEIIAGESPGAFRAPGRVLLPAVRAVAGTGADAFLTEEKTD